MTREAWDAADALLAAMPPAQAARQARRAVRWARRFQPDAVEHLSEVYAWVNEIYATRVSGCEPVRPGAPSAAVHQFPREGFVLGDHHCRAPGPEPHLLCLAPYGHEGDHVWRDWRGCRVRLPFSSATVPFAGFAG